MRKHIINFIDRVIGLEKFLRLIAQSKTRNTTTIPREIWRESNSIYRILQQQGAGIAFISAVLNNYLNIY